MSTWECWHFNFRASIFKDRLVLWLFRFLLNDQFLGKKSPIRFEFNFPTSGRLLWLCPSLWTSRPSRGVRQMRRRCCSKLSPQAVASAHSLSVLKVGMLIPRKCHSESRQAFPGHCTWQLCTTICTHMWTVLKFACWLTFRLLLCVKQCLSLPFMCFVLA